MEDEDIGFDHDGDYVARPSGDNQVAISAAAAVRPRTATVADRLISAVTVTDPGHPLSGQRLAVLSLACGRAPRFIAIALPDGRQRLIGRADTGLELPTATQQKTCHPCQHR